VPTSDFRYLHLADLAPAPYLGSTRAAVSTTDVKGGAWTARTTAAGSLLVRRPSGQESRLGPAGGWSPDASPTVTTDLEARVWVTGVARDGRILVAHTAPSASRLGAVRPVAGADSAPTSSPVVAANARDGVHLFSVTPSGTLLARHSLGPDGDRWSRPHRLGPPGAFAVHAAPAVASVPDGRLWVAAVAHGGALLTGHTAGGGTRWSAFHSVDQQRYSVTSTPALFGAGDGRVWLAAVDARGGLTVRHTDSAGEHWGARSSIGGRWSPYASPSLAVDWTGRTWLGAVTATGHVGVLSADAGSIRWRPAHGLPRVPASPTKSPTLAVAPDGGVLAGVGDARGHAVWRRPSGPTTLLPVVHGPRAGGFTGSPFL
jgi:hypothetical protein